MAAADLFQKASRFAQANSPTILTTVGVVGVVSTAVLAARGSFKAADIIVEAQQAMDEDWKPGYIKGAQAPKISTKDKAKLTWSCYAPAAGMAVLTCGAIISANKIGSKRTAAMAAAFTITEKALGDYKDQVVETLGETKEQRIRDKVAQKRVDDTGDRSAQTIVLGGQQLCYDMWSDRYWSSSMEDIKHAVNNINHTLVHEGYASLTDFYNAVGLDRTKGSDEIGWSSDKLLDVEFSSCITKDKGTALTIDFRVEPVHDYQRFR